MSREEREGGTGCRKARERGEGKRKGVMKGNEHLGEDRRMEGQIQESEG